MTVLELLGKATPWLSQKGSESAKADAEILLAHALKVRRIDLFLQFDKPVSGAEQDAFRELIRRRAAGEPVAYLVGKKGFWDFEVEVGPAVLVPRPETETLVELALARGGAVRGEGASARIVDIGTGSGCIAIALARGLPEAEVTAIDRSPDALAVAARNVAALCPGRVRLLDGDGLAPVSGERFDLVVSNPPYIPEADLGTLARDVREFEPRAALTPGPDGLALVRAWSRSAFEHLVPGGWCAFEIGIGQADASRAAFGEAGFADVTLTNDLGGIPRVVSGRRPPE